MTSFYCYLIIMTTPVATWLREEKVLCKQILKRENVDVVQIAFF
jgi:hypothetical protein